MMKAHKLARILLDGPDLEVSHVWDGATRTVIECVWESNNGEIVTSDYDQVVYDFCDQPKGTNIEYYRTPCNPHE